MYTTSFGDNVFFFSYFAPIVGIDFFPINLGISFLNEKYITHCLTGGLSLCPPLDLLRTGLEIVTALSQVLCMTWIHFHMCEVP